MIELRYEDLVANPQYCVRSIYERLQLGDFEEAKPMLEKRLANHKSYRTNSHRSIQKPKPRFSIAGMIMHSATVTSESRT